MDLNTIRHVQQPETAEQITSWRDGLAWLGGGTWLFSEPQNGLDTLIDLQALRWEALQATAEGLEIAATCPIGLVDAFAAPAAWTAAPLLRLCSHALLMSFKIANVATVGGNICMSLPAGAMISMAVALEGTYRLWPRDAAPRDVAAIDFVTGNHVNVLRPGELLRSIHLPAEALSKRYAFRRASLTKLGRSSALIVGTQTRGSDDLLLTITAATPHPVRLRFAHIPTASALRETIAAHVADDGWFADPYGTAPYKRHLAYHFAEQIRVELAQPEIDR